MKKITTILTVAAFALLTSCKKRAEVPPAHVGLVKTKDGILEEVYKPSSFLLPFAFRTKPQVILLETSLFTQKEEIEVYMPKDKLNFSFDIRGTYSIDGGKAHEIAEKNVAALTEEDHILKIDADSVYTKYVKDIIRTKVRSMISDDKTIIEVLSNLDAQSIELFDAVQREIEGSPIQVIRLAIAEAQPPRVIVDAQVAAKQREVAIQSAEADKQVKLKEAEASLEVAKKQQEIDLIEAETQVLVEKKLNESVNDAFVTQRALKILEKMSESDNKVFLLPQEALTNPSVMVGINSKAITE